MRIQKELPSIYLGRWRIAMHRSTFRGEVFADGVLIGIAYRSRMLGLRFRWEQGLEDFLFQVEFWRWFVVAWRSDT